MGFSELSKKDKIKYIFLIINAFLYLISQILIFFRVKETEGMGNVFDPSVYRIFCYIVIGYVIFSVLAGIFKYKDVIKSMNIVYFISQLLILLVTTIVIKLHFA
ncbi:hypothetical protein [Peptoniphilus obesi]|uniref:hypothetical protein n=1 Tax=Peptoniphilus obesi TaxID=1472765 RepID=UPI00056D46EC|nr:hypothetical protein [Peptoniphilus obesi]